MTDPPPATKTSNPGDPPPSPSSPAPVERIERQLHAFKVMVVILIVCLFAIIGGYLYKQHLGDPVTLWINGKAITTVRNTTMANQTIAEAEQSWLPAGYPSTSAVRQEKVQLRPAAPDAALDSDTDAQKKLHDALTVHIRAFVIMVKGKPSVGLPTSQEASDTLLLVKKHFADMPPDAELVGEPVFLQPVTIKNAAVSLARAKSSAGEAAPYFWTPPVVRTAVVKRGDTGSRIARHNHISLTDFLTANSGLNVNKLQPGDVVNVQKMPLLLSVRLKKKVSGEEKIVANAPESEAGKRHITYAITYINGHETRRDVLDMETLVKPRIRMSL